MRKVIGALSTAAKIAVDVVYGKLDEVREYDGLKDDDLRAFLERRGVSDMLFHRMYDEIDGIGIYTMDDGSKGIIYRLTPTPYLSEESEFKLATFFESPLPRDSVLSFSVYPSRNVESLISKYENLHHCEVNVRNKDALKRMIASRARYYRKGSRRSIYKNIDIKIRDFVNLVSIKFPPRTSMDEIKQAHGALVDQFQIHGLKNYPANEFVTLMREILGPGLDDWNAKLDKRNALNRQITGNDIEVKLDKKDKLFELGDNWVGQTLTTRVYPDYMALLEMQSIFLDPLGNAPQLLSNPFYINLSIIYDDFKIYIDEVESRAINTIDELDGYLGKEGKTKPLLRDRLSEAELVMDYIHKRGEFPMSAMWSITVFEENRNDLKRTVEKVKKAFKSEVWDIQEEGYASISFQAFLFSLPLQYKEVIRTHLKRFTTLFKSNNAALTPFVNDYHGLGEMRTAYVGRAGQLLPFCAYSGNSYSMSVLAKTGRGKSFMVADMVAHELASGVKVIMIDVGRSYQELNSYVGGEVIEFNSKNDPCLNFFTKSIPNTDKNGDLVLDEFGQETLEEDQLATIVAIIGMMMGMWLKATSSKESDSSSEQLKSVLASTIERCVATAFSKKGRSCGMKHVWEAIKAEYNQSVSNERNELAHMLEKAIIQLQPYSDPAGRYYRYFNGPNNIDFSNDFVILELEELQSKGNLLYVVYMALIDNVATSFYYDKDRLKSFYNDELWVVEDNQIVVMFLMGLARRIRKYRGRSTLISNDIKTFTKNKELETIFENTEWKVFLGQDKDALKTAYDKQIIAVNAFEYEILKQLKKTDSYSEFIIRHSEGMFLGRLFVDPFSRYLFATADSRDGQKVKSLVDAIGVTRQEAITILAEREEYPEIDIAKIIEKTLLTRNKE